MRERWSQVLTVFTGVLALLLAYVVADRRNPAERADAIPTTQPQAPVSPEPAPHTIQGSAGREVYRREGCARCHSIAGQGSPRRPLDGVGQRLSAEEIRNWIVAPPELEQEFSPGVFRIKQAYGKLPEAELTALVLYLQNPGRPAPR